MSERLLYHFTHVDNLPAILDTGALISDRRAPAGPVVTDVGDTDIKGRRRTCVVPVGPGGCVDEYVPLYFAPRSPTMYRIACDHRDRIPGRYPGGDHPLVYLVTSVERLLSAGLPWAASDGNCASPVTRYTATVADLAHHVDWPLMREQYWRNTPDDSDRMRRRMAEFLVHGRLPLDQLLGLATQSEVLAAQSRRLADSSGRTDVRVKVRSDWYFGFRPQEA